MRKQVEKEKKAKVQEIKEKKAKIQEIKERKEGKKKIEFPLFFTLMETKGQRDSND